MQTQSDVQLAVSMPEFDGPFDLLLSLIRKNEYPIDNLPIAEITRQFLAYIREAENLEMNLGGEFMETGSWLVLLKSRSMLPREAAGAAQDELRQAVEKYEVDREEVDKTKQLLGGLRSKRERVPVAGAPTARRVSEVDEAVKPTAAEVVRRIETAMANARAAAAFRITETASLTVQEQRDWILLQIASIPPGTVVSTAPWFEAQQDVGSRASLFLALLEFVKTGEILVRQRCEFGTIYMKRMEKNDRREPEEEGRAIAV